MSGVASILGSVAGSIFMVALFTLAPVMAAAFIMPVWWQYVFLAHAVLLLGSGVVFVLAAVVAALSTKTTGGE